MHKSEKSLTTISPGSLSRLWQARSLFLGGENRFDGAGLSPIKQVILRKLRPYLEAPELAKDNPELDKMVPGLSKLVPGLTSGITTGLALLSDQDCLEALFVFERIICEVLDELQPMVESYAKSEQLATTADRAE